MGEKPLGDVQITAPELPCWYCEGRDPEDGTPYDPADKSSRGAWPCEACRERARFRALLKRIEWGGQHGCPECEAPMVHRLGCELAALLNPR